MAFAHICAWVRCAWNNSVWLRALSAGQRAYIFSIHLRADLVASLLVRQRACVGYIWFMRTHVCARILLNDESFGFFGAGGGLCLTRCTKNFMRILCAWDETQYRWFAFLGYIIIWVWEKAEAMVHSWLYPMLYGNGFVRIRDPRVIVCAMPAMGISY